MTRYAIFGDTGGYASLLLASLLELGYNSHTQTLPEDLVVVHLGDLIHKGPATDDLVRIVDSIMRRNPYNWVQLLGNHEAQHVPGAPTFWRCACSDQTKEILHDWRATRRAQVAFSLAPSARFSEYADVAGKGLLLTHAGVTSKFWEWYLRDTTSADEAAVAINELPLDKASQPGIMLPNTGLGYYHRTSGAVGTKKRNPLLPVGPLWALASKETYSSWFDGTMPFVQVHGHTAAFDWENDHWYPGTPDIFKMDAQLDYANRASYTPVGNSLLVGLDPAFEGYASLKAQPYLLL